MVRAPGKAPKVEELIVEEPGPGEVLVRIQATGVCHTDLHASLGTMGNRFLACLQLSGLRIQ
ncbi:MAG: alcohol dehydrogenase catalytic domain-containing protein [Micromonosporaceae bacterium]